MNPEENTQNQNVEERKPYKALRTYQGDVDEILGKGKESTATIFVAEQKRKEEQGLLVPPKDTKNRDRLIMILVATLFVVGLSTLGVVYYFKFNEKVVVEERSKTLIGFSKEEKVNINEKDRQDFINKIKAEQNKIDLSKNSVLYINTQKTDGSIMATYEMLSLFGPRMIAPLVRSFGGEYMLGIYVGENKDFFILLSIDDFAESYAGMLKWESNVVDDIGQIFNIQKEGVEDLFIDEALKNRDLRVLKDLNKKTVLLYSFIDKKTLLITTNEDTFSALINKYQTREQVR